MDTTQEAVSAWNTRANDKLLDDIEKALADIESQDNDDHEVYLDLTEIARLLTRICERKAGK
jgi:hypothetical protein